MNKFDDIALDSRLLEHPNRTRVRRIVHNSRLKRLQHVHSAVVTMTGGAAFIAAAISFVVLKRTSIIGIGAFFVMFFLVGTGLTVGYHRLFTHKSFKSSVTLRVLLAIFGSMAAQGPVVFWVALHRMHHDLADHEGDPHSPNLHGRSAWQRTKGLLHAYVGWTLVHDVPNANYYAKDLLADKAIMTVNRLYYLWIALGLIGPALVCGAITRSGAGAIEGLLWGGLVRMFALHNMIWWITSFAHSFGTRDLVCKDLSTNNAWIALPTLGEGWHNNHHAFPSAAVLSFKWWQFDLSGWLILFLQRCGLVWDVQRPSRELIELRSLS